jgi:hypothetical protein
MVVVAEVVAAMPKKKWRKLKAVDLSPRLLADRGSLSEASVPTFVVGFVGFSFKLVVGQPGRAAASGAAASGHTGVYKPLSKETGD